MKRIQGTFFIFLLLASHARAQEIIHGPYLQNIRPKSVKVIVRTDEAGLITVKYRTEKRWKKNFSDQESEQHTIQLSKLKPDARYVYKVYLNSKYVERGRFKTPALLKKVKKRSRSNKIRIAVVGDSGIASQGQADVAAEIYNFKPKLILHTGDIVYPNGELENYKEVFFDPYKKLLKTIPIYPAVGNHDAVNIDTYLSIYNLPSGNSKSGTERYYSFKYLYSHFISLDTTSDFSSGSDQYNWLVNDLSNINRDLYPWIIVFFHHPPFSSGWHGDNIGVQEEIVPILEAYQVDAVFSGHEHNYERLSNISVAGYDNGSVNYFITGGAGAVPRSISSPSIYNDVFYSGYHFIGLTISRRQLLAEAINSTGQNIDTFTIRK